MTRAHISDSGSWAAVEKPEIRRKDLQKSPSMYFLDFISEPSRCQGKPPAFVLYVTCLPLCVEFLPIEPQGGKTPFCRNFPKAHLSAHDFSHFVSHR